MKKIILADTKLNQLVDDITAQLMDAAQERFENGAIAGADIASFCHHSQVNQFILFRIYQDWNAHIGQMVHPYFDFSDAEVKEGLRRFLNILSGHILVRQNDFMPLVQQAVYNSLKLILNAEDSIGKFFFGNNDAIGIEIYRKHAPYFSSFDFVIQAILKYHEKNELPVVERKLFFEKFDRVIELWEGKEGRNIAEYQRDLFRNLTGKELEDVIAKVQPVEEITLDDEPATLPEQQPAPELEMPVHQEAEEKKKTVIRIRTEDIRPVEEKPQPEVRETKTSTPPWIETPPQPEERERPTNLPPWVKEEVEEKSKTPNNEPKKEEKPRSLNEQFASREKQPSIVERGMEKKEGTARIEVRVKPTQEPPKEERQQPVEKSNPPQEQPATPRSLIGSGDQPEEFGKEPRTLAEKLRQQASPLGGDEEGSKVIKAEQIPVHKQFQYVQKVFGGSSVKFKVVLDKINKTETLEETNDVLDKYVFNDPNVNRNDKVSKEFEALVRARFQG